MVCLLSFKYHSNSLPYLPLTAETQCLVLLKLQLRDLKVPPLAHK